MGDGEWRNERMGGIEDWVGVDMGKVILGNVVLEEVGVWGDNSVCCWCCEGLNRGGVEKKEL